MPVNSLSNEFAYRINTNSPGINYQYTDKKYHVSIGGNVAYTHFKQTDKVADSIYKYNYTNILPQAVFNYKLNAYSNLNIKYTGITNQPNIHQLQPIKNNDDPLNIIVGNPALKQEFENTLQLGYTNYQVINEQYLFLSSFLVHITNMIGSSYEIDSFGRRIYKSVNVDDGFALSFGGGYSIKVPNTAIRLAFGPSINYTKYSNLINSLKNSSQTINVQVRLNAKIDKPNKYNLFATFIPSYNKSASTINTASITKFTN